MVDFSDARRPKFIQTTWLEGEEIMIEIRKTITLRETVFSPERRREFARDSLLEGKRFELLVPLASHAMAFGHDKSAGALTRT